MNKVTKRQAAELRHLAELPEEDINTGDIPEVSEWHEAERGRFYRPVKQQITLRIDADVLDWFKTQGNKYQTRINAALREYIENHRKTG
jgi:uncharacterized protein (DUF4415 family)